MLLQGSIRRFRLADVLQFLAQEGVTGVLEVRDFEEYGFIYLEVGRVEGISLPITDQKLGTRLVRAGLLSENRLAELLLEDAAMTKEERMHKPLGQRLVERGYAEAQAVQDIMGRQTHDQVFELAHWQNGTFIFEQPDEMPAFHVRIQGNVQELLMDAYRRIDEGEQARKAMPLVANELCYACPAIRTCSAQVQARYLKNDVCLWRELAAMQDEEFEKVRDARLLYRSRDGDERPDLDALLDEGVYHGMGTRLPVRPGRKTAQPASVKKPVAHKD
jgi:Domain of unknown function (DUF4388)